MTDHEEIRFCIAVKLANDLKGVITLFGDFTWTRIPEIVRIISRKFERNMLFLHN